MVDKWSPTPSKESQIYWQRANDEELWVQRCVKTGQHFFPPRTYSPFTAGGETEWVRASGRATLYSYIIVHKPAPGFEADVPYAVAVVDLEEGTRMMTNVVDVECTPEALVLDMALEVRFAERGSQRVPVFAPAVSA